MRESHSANFAYLVTDKVHRTAKFLSAVSNAVPVLPCFVHSHASHLWPNMRRRSHCANFACAVSYSLTRISHLTTRAQAEVRESHSANFAYLVTDKVHRTAKFLSAVSNAVPVVTPGWVDECRAQNKVRNGKMRMFL